MKIKKNVEAPISIRGRKYTELWAAVIEMPIDSWIEVDFEKPIESRQKLPFIIRQEIGLISNCV